MNVLEKKLSVPEASEFLRRLEYEAMESVLKAFRAQGPLTVYKEVLLDHLRSALFISLGEYAHTADKVVNNKALMEICNCLNPSYNTYSSWACCSAPLTPVDIQYHVRRLPEDVTKLPSNCEPSTSSSEAYVNYLKVKEQNNLSKLILFPKRPFVPEKLRQVLKATDDSKRINDVNNSVDIQPSTSKEKVNEGVEKEINQRIIKRKSFSNLFEGLDSFDVFMEKRFKRTKLPIPPPPQDPKDIYRENVTSKTTLGLPYTTTVSIGRKSKNKEMSIYSKPGIISKLRKDKDFPLKTEQELRGLKALMYIKEICGGIGSSPSTSYVSTPTTQSLNKSGSPESTSSNKENNNLNDAEKKINSNIYLKAHDVDTDIKETLEYILDETVRSYENEMEISIIPDIPSTSQDLNGLENEYNSGTSHERSINRKSEEFSSNEGFPCFQYESTEHESSSHWDLFGPEYCNVINGETKK